MRLLHLLTLAATLAASSPSPGRPTEPPPTTTSPTASTTSPSSLRPADSATPPNPILTPPAPPAPTPDDGTRVAILGYHDFSETEPETAMRIRTSKFRKQMEVLRHLGITVISLEDFLAWHRGEKSIPAKSALITLDDGWKSVYTDAFPIFKEFGYPFTLFLYKNYVDGGGKALTTAMIREMTEHGCTLGSHSISHPYPATIKAVQKKGKRPYDAFLRKEMGESKRFLEARFKTTIQAYAYPGGYHTPEMLEIAKEFDYHALVTVLPGKVSTSTDPTLLPRYMILGNYDKIFEIATNFRDSTNAPATPPGAITGLTESTPVPVTPTAGAIINSRLPTISANLSTITDLDPASLTMKVSGFGEVPATFNPADKSYSWQVNRRLRQSITQVSIHWLDTAGNPSPAPLRWSFQIDRSAAYLPTP